MTNRIYEAIQSLNKSLSHIGRQDGIAYAYQLINESGACVYAGQTENLKRRIIQHSSDGKEFSDVQFIRCLPGDVDDAEAIIIAKSKPMMNKAIPSNRFFVSHKWLCDEISKTLLNERIILEMPASAGKFRYIDRNVAEKVLSEISDLIMRCENIDDYDFDSAERLVALGEDKQ